MLHKTIIPCAEDLGGESPVQILKISNRGLDKTASMQKRAAAFNDIIKDIKPMEKKAYLHVITTGAWEHFGKNRNNDAWNEDTMEYHPPMPKNASCEVIQLEGGLRKYHDTYLDKAAVYQEHKTDQQPSGMVKAAMYNENMHRGELLIQVDVQKWAPRLNKRASGQDIFLSVGASLKRDLCSACGHQAHTFDQHCDHIKKQAGAILEDGTAICMINDAPKFYDISGVNVPADSMAFVLRKVASGEAAEPVIAQRYLYNMTRPSMGISKAAKLLNKLSTMEKQIICKLDDDPIFSDSDKETEDFLHAVENYNADEIIDQCNRKAILLSPKMLFKIIGKQSDQRDLFDTYADNCCCDCRHLMQDMLYDPLFKNELKDGSFDSVLPVDINLANLLESFVPQFGVSRPAINGKVIRITIRTAPMEQSNKIQQKIGEEQQKKGTKKDKEELQKEASLVNDEFRRTYARYVLSFASRNNDDTCNLALQKLARYRTVKSL